jgi:hypothetical protein
MARRRSSAESYKAYGRATLVQRRSVAETAPVRSFAGRVDMLKVKLA